MLLDEWLTSKYLDLQFNYFQSTYVEIGYAPSNVALILTLLCITE